MTIAALPSPNFTGADIAARHNSVRAVVNALDLACGVVVETLRTSGMTDAALIALAVTTATARASVLDTSNPDAQASVDIVLEPGRVYDLGAGQVSIAAADLHINFVCHGGRATLTGTGKGLVFEAVRNITFDRINFVGFTTATEWDTENVDSSLIRYNGCDFLDCTLGVDTVSYAASRSTVLEFNDCRAGGTSQLVNSYCDMLIFNGGHYRNADSAGAFVWADSQVIVNGGIWTPYAAGASARWFDLTTSNSFPGDVRGLVINSARFGPEQSGGIPIVYSSMDGNATDATRTTMTRIAFNDAYLGSANTATPKALVVLRSNAGGTATLAPNTISIRGGSINCPAGAVVTEAGLPIGLAVGEFTILMDDAAQTRWGNVSASVQLPLVGADLEKYVARWRIDQAVDTTTGSHTYSIGTRRTLRLQPASAADLTNLTDALDGHIVTLIALNGNATVKDASTGGSFELSGGADFAMTSNDTLTVVWSRASAKWFEVARSAN